MTMFASHAPGEVIDAIRPDLEAFTSLWTALRVNYEGTNITRTVARLLHMYQPEEGVVAYERLLRTLFVLLEDFDSDGLQLLVSMVPPPKGVSDEVVKEVFNRATGFVRVDAPIFHKNTETTIAASSTSEFPYQIPETQSCSSTNIQQFEGVCPSEKSSPPEIKKNPTPSTVQNDNNGLENGTAKSPQTISHESSDVFRGFPPSEIFNTQSHVQSMKNFYRPSTSFTFPQSRGQNFLNFGQIVGQNSGQLQQPIGPGLVGSAYRPKWFQSPYLIQKNSFPIRQYQDFYLKTVNNQYVKVPAAKMNDFHQRRINTAQASYQNLYNNPHDYLRNRSNTVTSGLLEKIQRHRSLQEAAIKKILTECEPSKNASALSVPRVSDTDIPSSRENVEFEVVDLKATGGDQERKMTENFTLKKTSMSLNSKSRNVAIKTCDTSEQPTGAGNDRSGFVVHVESKIDSELNLIDKNRETFEEFAKEVRMRQRAIQEDIYKMDVVQNEVFTEEVPDNKEDADNSIKPEMLTASEELRNSCKNFIDRIKTEKFIEIPTFPNTRALSDVHEQSAPPQPSESNLWRLLTSKSISKSDTVKSGQIVDLPQVEESEKASVEQELIIPSTEVPSSIKESIELPELGSKRVIRRKKPEVPSMRAKSQRVGQKGPLTSQSMILPDHSVLTDRDIGLEPDIRMLNNYSQPELTSRCPVSTVSQTASSGIGPATTMAELAAYKKQYYDALLSIQKAKAAVANSLAISSVGSSRPGFDPYYYNYLQQRRNQILQRRQHQMIMGQRFSQHQSMPSGTPWYRTPNWRYPVISQSRIPQRAEMLHSSSPMWPPGVGYLARDSSNMAVSQRQQLNVVQQAAKPPMKRKKLEEIVGKLKETESNGTNN